MNGNWSQLDMTTELGASTTSASLALTTFWAMVTIGRVLFAVDPALVPDPPHLPPAPVRPRRRASWSSRSLPSGQHGRRHRWRSGWPVSGCSALLPLTISFAQADLVAMSAATAGLVIAAYQLGYGIAAFGAGPAPGRRCHPASHLRRSPRWRPGSMAVLSFVIARPSHQVTALHPRPA